MQLRLMVGMSLACYRGGGSWSDDAYRNITSTKSYKTKKVDEIFSTELHPDMNPIGVKFRESRDSVEHPESLAIMVNLDVTGSMGRIPQILITEKLGKLMSTVIAHGVPHPQIMFAAIGDQASDRAPLQVGQFESDTAKIDECLTKIWVEGNGGGQQMESYPLAWLFAGRHTSIDCFEKRGVKGFLFTIGDESFWDTITASELRKIMGYAEAEDLDVKKLLEEAQRMYHVFHIHVNEGGYRNNASIFKSWKDVLGERFIVLEDHEAIGELIASTVAVIHGVDLKSITKTFDAKTAGLVTTALANVTGSLTATNKKDGIVKL